MSVGKPCCLSGSVVGNGRKLYRQAVVLTLCCLCVLSGRVEATEGGGDETFGYVFAGEIVSWIISLGFAAENLHSVVKNEQGSAFWRYGGWIVGGINVAGGSILLVGEKSYGWPEVFSFIGVTHLAFGVINIGFAIWASSQPKRTAQKVTLAPIFMPDINGNAAFGIGLRLVDW